MKNAEQRTELLMNFAPKVGGVFTLADLSSLFNIPEGQTLWLALKRFEHIGMLSRYCRGIYVAKNFEPQILASKVRADSYISMGNALAYHRLIGTESPFKVSSVVPSKAKEYFGVVDLSYSRISAHLYFGFFPIENGVKMADAEKAVLDTLYFYFHKKKFSFNPFQDIHYSELSDEKLTLYLEKYRNPKFVAFARKIIHENVKKHRRAAFMDC